MVGRLPVSIGSTCGARLSPPRCLAVRVEDDIADEVPEADCMPEDGTADESDRRPQSGAAPTLCVRAGRRSLRRVSDRSRRAAASRILPTPRGMNHESKSAERLAARQGGDIGGVWRVRRCPQMSTESPGRGGASRSAGHSSTRGRGRPRSRLGCSGLSMLCAALAPCRAYRRHMHLVGTAQLARIFVMSAGAGPAVACHADAHIAQAVARAAASHGEHLRAQPRIGAQELAHDLPRGDELRLERILIALGDANAPENSRRARP